MSHSDTDATDHGDHGHAAAHGHGGGHGHGAAHEPAFYIRIWGILLVLLVISVLGPELEIQIVTLTTAFGIAFVKAYLVAKHFMHLDVERPIVWYALTTSLAFMVLFFAAVSPDVMEHEGTNWENVAAKAEIERALREGEGHHGEAPHGDASHGDASHGEAGHAAPAAHGSGGGH